MLLISKEKQVNDINEAYIKSYSEQLALRANIATSEAWINIYADYEYAHNGMNDNHETKTRSRAKTHVMLKIKMRHKKQLRLLMFFTEFTYIFIYI